MRAMASKSNRTESVGGARPAWVPRPHARVVGLRDLESKAVYDVPRDRNFTIGKLAGNDIVLSDRTVSDQHCVFEWQGNELWLEDLQSKNGTLLNGVPVRQAQLLDGFVLLLGKTTLVAFAEDSRHRRSRDEILVGTDPGFRIAVDRAIDAAAEGHNLVLVGEQGTGRGTLARAIHEVTCGPALPFLRIGAPQERNIDVRVLDQPLGGTIYFHRFETMPQGVFRRIIAALAVGVVELPGGERAMRVVASSLHPMPDGVLPERAEQVRLPSLRERGDDLLLLLDAFTRELIGPNANHRTLGAQTLAGMRRYQWPGNVAELREAVVRLAAVVRCGSAQGAADAMGMSKSGIADWLYRRGIPLPK